MGLDPRPVHTSAEPATSIARSLFLIHLRGRDESSCWCGSGHSPATPCPLLPCLTGFGLGGLLKKPPHRLRRITFVPAATATTPSCSVSVCCLRDTGTWKMTSGNMFPHSARRLTRQRNPPYSVSLQLWKNHLKVDADLEVDSRPALCARTAVFNAPDNLGKCLSLQTVDLRIRRQKCWHSKLHRLKMRPVKVHVDALWKAVNVKLVRQRRSWT